MVHIQLLRARPSFFLLADDSLASLGEKDDDEEEEAGCARVGYLETKWAWVKMHTIVVIIGNRK